MKKHSAGILLYRHKAGKLQVFLGHPGSPLWANKDNGYWSVPKGKIDKGETTLDAAKREFTEETGLTLPPGELIELGNIEQYGVKVVSVWATEYEGDTSGAKSCNFQLEWPPKSGNFQEYPEMDRLEWFDLHEAARKINKYQVEFLIRLSQKLGQSFNPPADDSPAQSSLL